MCVCLGGEVGSETGDGQKLVLSWHTASVPVQDIPLHMPHILLWDVIHACTVTSSVRRLCALMRLCRAIFFNSPANYVVSFAVNAKADRCTGSRWLELHNSHHGLFDMTLETARTHTRRYNICFLCTFLCIWCIFLQKSCWKHYVSLNL